MLEKYRYYFSIDEAYFPAVTEDLINKGQVDWKKFYPHETFVKLISDTVKVLTRKTPLSIWVEGAYGTGKSHAVLTLKKLLDASDADTREYFHQYNLDNDLCNQLQNAKSQGKTILTVHKYGSSSIRSDNDLIISIQESIKKALDEKGIEYQGESVLKDAVISWLSDDVNKNYFNSSIQGDDSDYFDGDNVDDIIKKLNTFTDMSLLMLMNKIFDVAKKRGITALSMTIDSLVVWIKDVIKKNDLKAIVFIWDEFTNYFENNMRALTGFQQIVEISATDPFYFIIITHKSTGLFNDTDKDQKRILDRFVKPTCKIELPENMAFQLMGAALQKNKDPQILKEWNESIKDLCDQTQESRSLVKQRANISDKELQDILPIHPYTALLLKYISSAFDSNQRSMFDFIQNDRGDEVKGFQWFIDNYGPESDNKLLTINLLWDFFYEKDKDQLSSDIRSILDCYARAMTRQLSEDEESVLKTVLLLQAISQNVGDSVELFIPNDKNINYAFEGSNLEYGAASRCAEKLVRDEVLYKKTMGNNKMQYSALVNATDNVTLERNKEDVRKKTVTSALVHEGALAEAVSLSGALNLRYVIREVTVDNFKQTVNVLRNRQEEHALENKILALIAFAKDDMEGAALSKQIQETVKDPTYKMIFIDASSTPLGQDAFGQYVENMGNSISVRKQDNGQANQYESNAKDVLRKWKNRISTGEFIVYTENHTEGERFSTIDELFMELSRINKEKFPDGIENYKVTETMYMATSLKMGAECGATQKTSGQFNSGNVATKLEMALKGAWLKEKYWEEDPLLLISRIKIQIDQTISQAFAAEGRISIAQIYDVLKAYPYGFMPCNLTAFVVGFLLKEYATEKFNWSDSLSTETMSVLKLKEMIDEVIKLQQTPNTRYKDKFIVAMTDDEKSFIEATSVSFNIPSNLCSSIEQTRDRIRNKMKEISFPIWCLKYILDTFPIETEKNTVAELIDNYIGIANSNNISNNATDVEYALKIGKLATANNNLAKDFKLLLTKENCMSGMVAYLNIYNDGMLTKLATEIGDNGQFINALKKKFDVADAANWVWNIDTANKKIDEIIIEYKIIFESNKLLSKTTSFNETIQEWCEKCNYIRISYAAAKNYLDEISPFLEMLVYVKKSGILQDSQKEKFLELLMCNSENFNNFYNNQLSLFKQVCEFYVDQFTDEEVSDFYKDLPTGMFIREKADYNNIIASRVDEFKGSLGKERLKQLWKEKTGTSSPKEWSQKYKMSILCMVDDASVPKARKVFETISRNKPEITDVENAIKFLENAEFLKQLSNEDARNTAFIKCIITEDFTAMLTDIDDVKEYLATRVSAEPYDWFGSLEVSNKIKQKAEANYNAGGSDKALEKIDQMDVSEVKHYLKDLIKENMKVGIEIIKKN